jgi:L-glutamine-phosphate cytidylyltransferase
MPHFATRWPRTAVILAAGAGSRLLPHTAHAPKCLTAIAGYPILQYQIAALRRCGIEHLVIVVGYLSACIRDFVKGPVTYVENTEYSTTNSSHSLWLARRHLRDGYIHLNSDLLFEPGVLEALLASPQENAVVVERSVRAASDMMKAEMEGDRIRRMGKRLSGAAAEVVGPAKFGPDGARRIVDTLDRLETDGERNRWAYSIFGELADDLGLAGVDNPGYFWAEVDTIADARDAERRVPRRLIDVASGLDHPVRERLAIRR